MRRQLILSALVSLFLVHCGYPGKDLNPLEKQADIEWVFGTFERNYAPAEWKANKHGTSLAQIKAECNEKAKNINKGDEFIGLLNECVNRFQDAHTRIMAGGQALPEMLTVAYLGFRTEFVKFDLASTVKTDPSTTPTPVPTPTAPPTFALKVTKLLATTQDPRFPIAKDDFITKIDDHPVKEYLIEHILPKGNLGNELSSLVMAGHSFGVRDSSMGLLPTEDTIRLEFVRGGLVKTTVLPWNRKDLFAFMNEQRQAEKDLAEQEKEKQKDESEPSHNHKQSVAPSFWVGPEIIDHALQVFAEYRKSGISRVSLLLSKTFQYFSYSPVQGFLAKLKAESATETKTEDPIDKVIGATKFDISVAPFTARIFFDDKDNRIGFIRINDFGIGDDEVKTFKALLNRMNQMKVKGLILDLLNNGGGSLEHGLAMADALTEQQLKFPKMQVALNDHWLNGFRGDAVYAPTDAQKTMAKRVLKLLEEDIAANRRISRPISSIELAPFVLSVDKQHCVKEGSCLKPDTKLVLLVNEMCASMCDIFAGVFRDNQLGTIVGSQTMGAGGNVVVHGFSPVTKIALSQTESLVVDSNGQYLENQGVVPNEIIDTIYDRASDYVQTYKKAISLIQ